MMSCPKKSRDDERVICALMQHYEQNLDYIWPHYTQHLQWVLLVSNALAALSVYKTSVSPHFSPHLETLSFCLNEPVVKHIIYVIKQMKYKKESNGKIAFSCAVAAFSGFIIFQVHLQVHRWLSPSANVAWVCFTMWCISWWNYTKKRERDTWCIRQVPLKTWKSPSTVSKWRSRNVPFGSSCAASSDTSTTAFALNLTPSAKFFCPICLSKSTHVYSYIRILQKTCQTGRRRILLWQPQPIAFSFIKNANWVDVQPWCSSSLLITKLQTEFKK